MKHLSLIASALAVLGLTACEKGLVDDIEDVGSGQVTNSVLQVRTRAGSTASDDAATVAYPVTVYVFQGDECRAAQTIGDEGQTLNIPLVEGTYTVFAVGGASSADYVLPSASDALTTSAIALREGHEHGDLMAAKATATLVDGGTNTVTLGMERKTMLIQSVEIKKVPTAATAVSVTIAPLWQSLTVGGTFSMANGCNTIALTKQEDGRTWQNAASAYLLPPSSQPASIAVNITIGGTTKTYTYSTSNELEAGYKISIVGTYTEAVGVSLTGTIEGATWQGERTISFDFDESGSTATDDIGDNTGNAPATFPAAGDTYQGCFVLASEVAADGESAEVTLLAPTELTGWYDYDQAAMATAVEAALGQVAVTGISGWAVPTRNEAKLIYQSRQAIGDLTAATYLWQADNGSYYAFKPSSANETNALSSGALSATTVLRPVATVTINNE